MGNVIPFDSVVVSGDGMVNQASLTGEAVPVHRKEGDSVYAGTVLEEGELTGLYPGHLAVLHLHGCLHVMLLRRFRCSW